MTRKLEATNMKFIIWLCKQRFRMTNRDTIYRARELMKLCALVHLMDGIQVRYAGWTFILLFVSLIGFNLNQTNLAGILRSLGGQIYGSVAIFIAFYVIGAPVGITLSLKTPMLIQGFLVGFMIGCCVLALAQIIYIYQANWTRVAQRVGCRNK